MNTLIVHSEKQRDHPLPEGLSVLVGLENRKVTNTKNLILNGYTKNNHTKST
jgi:hypothetical protein